MLELQQILSYYPANQQQNKEHILREYLQYKILKSIFSSTWAEKLRFIGGTSLRIVYGNARFSEDLDFDNDGSLTFEDFNLLSEKVKKDLELQGLIVRIKTLKK